MITTKSINLKMFNVIISFVLASVGLLDIPVVVSLYSDNCQLVQTLEVESLLVAESRYMIYNLDGASESNTWILDGITDIQIRYGENELILSKQDHGYFLVDRLSCFSIL